MNTGLLNKVVLGHEVTVILHLVEESGHDKAGSYFEALGFVPLNVSIVHRALLPSQ